MDYIEKFKNYLISEKDYSEHTVRNYIADLRSFAQYLLETTGDTFSPENITSFDVTGYRSFLQTVRIRETATINRAIASIRAFCEWAIDEGITGNNPASRVKYVTKSKQPPSSLSRKEQNALLREVEKDRESKHPPKNIHRDSSIIYVLLYCGLRVDELCNVKMGDVSMSDRKGKIKVQGKGMKEREVPINVEARKILNNYMDMRRKRGAGDVDFIFYGQRGPITPHCVRYVLNKYGSRAGIIDLHPHKLRHTFIRNMLDRGVPEMDIMQMTGHEDKNTLALYSKATEEKLQAHVDKVRMS